MNLLPGLRELRAPLAAGYLWLAGLWLSLTHAGWLPSTRPPGNGEVARLWDLGGALGKTLVLAAVTFIAYLIGSFLQINPDGRVAAYLAPEVLFRRRPRVISDTPTRRRITKIFKRAANSEIFKWAANHLRLQKGRQPRRFEKRAYSIDQLQRKHKINISRYVAHSLSVEAISDMVKLLEQRHLIANQTNRESAVIIEKILDEISQLASRLLVKNKELYSKYDKHMAESAVRINVSIPLTLLLILATWISGIPIWLQLVLTIVISIFGFMLLRQGFIRRVWAQDVIVQALIIDEIQSTNIRPEKPPEESPGPGYL